jgi:glycosyltransferase involved in cell wall biosynthesis
MKNLYKEKVAAIVPARNEEKTIKQVLRVILDSGCFDEVIVVDGASFDNTAEISETMGVKVIRSPKREGKGAAMKKGVQSTDASIVVFFDADLIGLAKEHILQLIDPVLKKKAVMCTGERNHYLGLPYIISKIDPLSAIGGERAMRRSVLENIPEKFIKNFAVETSLNYYCIANNLPSVLVELKGLKLVPKEKKWGLAIGLLDRVREIWQLIKIRFLIIINKKDFKINKNESI